MLVLSGVLPAKPAKTALKLAQGGDGGTPGLGPVRFSSSTLFVGIGGRSQLMNERGRTWPMGRLCQHECHIEIKTRGKAFSEQQLA